MGRVDRRFWSSTRGRILTLLRPGSRTVNELAAALGLTANAVRSQLTALERDGLVRPSGSRRGPRKPTMTYDLSAEADQLFPRAYGPVLAHVIDALRTSLPAPVLDEVLQAAGHRVAQAMLRAGGHATNASPADRAVAAIRELGGWCSKHADNGRARITCTDCPLAAAAAGRPEVCRLVETALTEAVGAQVRQHCRTDVPRCRFEIGASPA
jgi:predicted ArsR family transcriptional regulator